jgi:hypothetical protein
MKHLFNNLTEIERQHILEMHKTTKTVVNEQLTPQQKKPCREEMFSLGQKYKVVGDNERIEDYIDNQQKVDMLFRKLIQKGQSSPTNHQTWRECFSVNKKFTPLKEKTPSLF